MVGRGEKSYEKDNEKNRINSYGSDLGSVFLTACGSGNAGTGTSAAAGKETGDNKVLKVAMECSYAPYNWTQPTDAGGAVPISGSSDFAYGYDVMMAKKR